MVRPILTMQDLIHTVTNSLSLISSHSQYLLSKGTAGAQGADELRVIYEEAERAASLLGQVPRDVASTRIDGARGARPRRKSP